MTGTRMMSAPHGLVRREHAGVVIDLERAEKGDVVDEPDQGAEHDGAESGDDADDDRQKRKPQQPHPRGKFDLHLIVTFAPSSSAARRREDREGN